MKKIKNIRKSIKILMLVISLVAITSVASAISFFHVGQTSLSYFNATTNSGINLDVNHDGVIDQKDLDLVIQHFGERGFHGWIAEDVNKDGKVNIWDIGLLNAAVNIYKSSGSSRFSGVTYLNVTPPLQYVKGSGTFSVIIHLGPGEPVFGVQTDFSFNPSLVQAVSVTNANTTVWNFFQAGTINNVLGTITMAAVAKIGGNVSLPTDCLNITFTAKTTDGTSYLNLQNPAVVNETGTGPVSSLTLNNGSVVVDNTNPLVSITSPSAGSYVKGTISVTATITEVNPDKISVMIDDVEKSTGLPYSWDTTGYSDGSHTVKVLATDKAGNIGSDSVSVTVDNTAPSVNAGADMVIKVATQKIDASASDATSGVATILWTFPANVICSNTGVINPTFSASVDGVYTVTLTVTDNAGNSAFDIFVLTWDVTPPTITNILVTFSDPIDTDPTYGWINISCTVTDVTTGVDDVYIYLNSTSYLMQNIGSTYYYNTTLDCGNRTYYIYATDNLNNAATSSTGQISVPPNWDIIIDGKCDIWDVSQLSNKWGQTGTPGWIREDINNDGKVDIWDVGIISSHWGQIWYV